MNYYLIGMMGSGKTTIGNLLSKKLDHNFFDIDQIIEKNYKTTISNFFEIYGEKKFRHTESSMLKSLMVESSHVGEELFLTMTIFHL